MWNDELAQMAQEQVERCIYQNLTDALTHELYSNLGDNVYTNRRISNYSEIVEEWHSQRLNYNYTTDVCLRGRCAEYKQVRLPPEIEDCMEMQYTFQT